MILITASLLLLVPYIAMKFDTAVDWGISDFIIMGILLFGTGGLCEIVLRKVQTVKNRIIICAVILLAFFLIWAELAVGIFGTPFAGS